MSKYKWAIWVDGDLDRFIGSNNIPKIGDTVYVSGVDPDCDDEAIVKEVSESANEYFDVDAERVEA